MLSRRSFVAASAAAVLPGANRSVSVGLELYSVRDELSKDLMGTVRTVAQMGYPIVEFYAPYYRWTPAYAQDVRKLMDGLGIECRSTHNSIECLRGLDKAIELNQAIGSKSIILASAGSIASVNGWKEVADLLTAVQEKLKPLGMRTGYHNHQLEFHPLEGKLPMEILAAGTPPDVVLQLDVGTCLEAGHDPVAWIRANPGRIRSIHCKDWGGQDRGYKVLFGEGEAPWSKIFNAAETWGGVEYYLIEQEGSRFPSLETAQRCLNAWKKMRG